LASSSAAVTPSTRSDVAEEFAEEDAEDATRRLASSVVSVVVVRASVMIRFLLVTLVVGGVGVRHLIGLQ
jgi:hypothetical protein